MAPFQLLAINGSTFERRDHGWHLAVADRMARAEPALIQPTRRVLVDADDSDSTDAAVSWWEDLTASGGEGMVVKPFANLSHGRRGRAQPGLKVRPRVPAVDLRAGLHRAANLDRPRQRNVGRKRSLAVREYAQGLEALSRAAAGEPLWRVHEPVFAVLALESEPVDPRL